MSDEHNPAGPDGLGEGTGTPSAADADGHDEPLRNKREVVELRKQTRNLERKVDELTEILKANLGRTSEQPKPKAVAPEAEQRVSAGKQALAELQDLKRELALEKALGAHGITGQARELIELAAKAAKPDDLHAFVAKYVPPKKSGGDEGAPAAAAVAPQAAPAAPTNTGAPAVGGQPFIPESPFALSPAAMAAMSDEDRIAHFERYVSKTSNSANPFISGFAKKRR